MHFLQGGDDGQDVLAAGTSASPVVGASLHAQPMAPSQTAPASSMGAQMSESPVVPVPAEKAPAKSRKQRAPGYATQHALGSVPERSLRSQSPVASMPVIAPAGKPEKGALTLSSSDIVTPSSRKRPGDNQRSAKITKKAKQGGKPAAQKSCPDCGKVQPGARQKKCSCGHDFQAVK